MWEIVVMVLTFGGWEKGKWIDAKPGGKNQPTKSKVYSLVAKESWKQQQQRENFAIPADFASLGFRGGGGGGAEGMVSVAVGGGVHVLIDEKGNNYALMRTTHIPWRGFGTYF